MKTVFRLFAGFVLALAPLGARAEATNLTATLSVDRPLAGVVSAIHVYYTSMTNEPGFYIYQTNRISGLTNNAPGGSYDLNVFDCEFRTSTGLFHGDLVATSIATNVTRLDLVSHIPLPDDAGLAARQKEHARTILIQIARIAETAGKK